jgi:stalled ribosome alternative rescue factor ArfA
VGSRLLIRQAAEEVNKPIKPKKRSPAAKLIQDYPHIVEKPKKGKGSYVRKKGRANEAVDD